MRHSRTAKPRSPRSFRLRRKEYCATATTRSIAARPSCAGPAVLTSKASSQSAAARPPRLPKGVSRKGVHWIEPQLVAEVEFADWTADAILRQASFQGLREDKDARDVVYDPKTRAAVEPAAKPKKAPARPKEAASKEAEPLEPQRARGGRVLFECVRLTHPDRI